MTNLTAGSEACGFRNWKAWGLRPIVLFAATYLVISTLHELTHALTAYVLRIPSMFHVGVNLDRAHGTLNQRAVIGVAGPLFALGGSLPLLERWLVESSPWRERDLALGWMDIAVLLIAALVVRLMVGGITFAP
jgi:hypothetical protein